MLPNDVCESVDYLLRSNMPISISRLDGYCQDIRRTVLTLSTHAQTSANFRNSSSFINQPIAPSSSPTTTSSPPTLGDTIIGPSILSPGIQETLRLPQTPPLHLIHPKIHPRGRRQIRP